MKKIYCVTVENEFYCVAENQNEAEQLYEEVKRDLCECTIWATPVGDPKMIPKEWMEGLTYGIDEDITLKDWIADREKEETEKKKQEELDALQLKLPLLG